MPSILRLLALPAVVWIITTISPLSLAEGATRIPKSQITILYDAFGRDPSMKKDWGFSALVEIGGKRILFDTGDDREIFAANARAKGVDFKTLDFVVVSHRHSDHIAGLSHVLAVNPEVKVFAPKENFGIFGSSLPSSFYRKNESLPAEMRYFDGQPRWLAIEVSRAQLAGIRSSDKSCLEATNRRCRSSLLARRFSHPD